MIGCIVVVFFFLFKQKTAYELRISDWSSDVCSSDLLYREAFTPFTSLSQEALRLRCLAIVGAAEAIAREMNRGRIDDRTASAALHSLIRSWLAWGGL